jgi:UDP-N-acetylglucosamine/UDP-N-acetylgalactosamine diphosphorylase
MQDLIQLRGKLRPYGQEHILGFWGSLTQESRAKLVAQIESLDFDVIQMLFQSAQEKTLFKPAVIEAIATTSLEDQDSDLNDRWKAIGSQAIKNNELAVLLVAGGQGSRLGFDGPKGCYRPLLPSGKSIFQVQAERLLGLSRRNGVRIPWYIMTSPLNDAETRKFFHERNYFGYPRSHIFFFEQGMLPAIDTEGKILMSGTDELALVPDGNGGCFQAMMRSGAWDDLRSRGVKHLYVYGVDNLMTRIGDARFLGFHINHGKSCSTKVVRKRNAAEKMGVVAKINSKPGIVEYSDLPEDQKELQDAQGNLLFGMGSIAVHLFDVAKLEQVLKRPLPYHQAFKKVQHIDAFGEWVNPTTENAWKFEQFLFDVFPQMGELAPFEVLREEEFAPVKNAHGEDSPYSARELLLQFHTKQLKNQGLPVQEGLLYEVSGLAYPDFLAREWQACMDANLVIAVDPKSLPKDLE